ncbi:MAG: sugar phosphate isomerase/epimerase family protein, partial [Pirellulales bacterium]
MLTSRIAMQIACSRRPIKQALTTAARLGARAVEIDARHDLRVRELTQTGVRQLKKLLDDLDLKVSAIRFPTRRGYDTDEDLDRRVTATQAAMRFARQLGTDVVINHVGTVAPDDDDPSWRLLVEVLTGLGDYGHRVGSRIAAATGPAGGEELARLIAALPDEAIGVHLDPLGLILAGHSVVDTVTRLGPAIVHVWANDGVRDVGAGRGIEVELGRGVVDYPALLATLEEIDYRGWLTVARRQTEDPAADLGAAVQYLANLAA